MENSFQTSFIPKKPIAPVTNTRASSASTSLFTVLSLIILIVMGIASGGLYFYKNYLTGQKVVLSKMLDKAKQTFEKDTINELELFDKRVSASKQVLNSHIVLSPMFALIGNLTIPTIQYTKFSHTTTDKGFFVNMSGVASDYRSIALQADVFNTAKGRSFKNVIFSNLTKDTSGHIGFDLQFTVDPALLSYENDVAVQEAQAKSDAANPQTQTPPTTISTPPATVGATPPTTTGGPSLNNNQH